MINHIYLFSIPKKSYKMIKNNVVLRDDIHVRGKTPQNTVRIKGDEIAQEKII